MDFLKAFIVGGAICAIGQLLIDKTKMTPARILTSFVVSGVLLTAVGLYKPLVDWGGAGATIPISGFGYALAKGVEKAVYADGVLGVIAGGITATAAGVTAAILFGFLASLLSKPTAKE